MALVEAYLRVNGLHQAQFKDPVFGSLVMLEKGHRGQVAALRRT